MKKITPILLAGIALAFCGCSTDEPIFSSDASKAKASNSNPDANAEVSRDVYNNQNSGASMGTNNPHANTSIGGGNGGAQQANPYSH
jgi:hypothetical protein